LVLGCAAVGHHGRCRQLLGRCQLPYLAQTLQVAAQDHLTLVDRGAGARHVASDGAGPGARPVPSFRWSTVTGTTAGIGDLQLSSSRPASWASVATTVARRVPDRRSTPWPSGSTWSRCARRSR